MCCASPSPRPNAAGRKPRAEEDKDTPKQPRHEEERVLETADTAHEQPGAGETRVEAQAEPETPRRRGWWQR